MQSNSCTVPASETGPLTANYQMTSNEVAIATNEVAYVSSWQTSYPQGTKLVVVKDGITIDIPGVNINGLTVVPQIKIAGPATIRLISPSSSFGEPFLVFLSENLAESVA